MEPLTRQQYENVANDSGCIAAWCDRHALDRLHAWQVMLSRKLPRHTYRVLATMRRRYWQLNSERIAAFDAYMHDTGTRDAYHRTSGECYTFLRDMQAYYADALRRRKDSNS